MKAILKFAVLDFAPRLDPGFVMCPAVFFYQRENPYGQYYGK